jgi:TP901 family phage tail tape measure protein
MADTQVKILITAIDDASRVFRDVLDNSDSMASKLMTAGDTFETMGNAVKDFTRPLSRGLNASKDAAIGFESEMAEVAKTTGFSAKQVAQVGAVTKQLSREIPMTVSGLNNIAVAAGQSGIALKDTKGFIKDVSKAATAFYAGGSAKEMEAGAEKAALAFGKLTNVFGIPIRDVNTLAAAINVLGDSSIASEKDILNAMTRTAGLGVQAKMSAKDLAALNASMISLGMAPSVAATATNALLSRLTTAEIQSARFQKGLEMIGISASEMQNLVQSGGNNAIFALSNALDKLDPVNRAKAIGQMFGAEHSDNVGIFLERINVYKDLLGSVANDQSNLNRYNKVFEAQLNTTASQLQILNNSFKELAVEIGTALLPAVRAFVKFLTPIIHGITAFVKKHPWLVKIGAALVGIAAAAGSTLLAMAALSRIWGGLSAGIPILSQLSNRFLGVGHPISKMLNWLAQANQRLIGVGEASEGIKLPKVGKLPTVKECLPVCICPKICAGFEAKLKALVAKLDLCIPICICPDDCGDGKKKRRKKKPPGDDDKGPPDTPDTPLPGGDALPVAKEVPALPVATEILALPPAKGLPALPPAKALPALPPAKDLVEGKGETPNTLKNNVVALTTALIGATSAINKLAIPAKTPAAVPVTSPVDLATQTALIQQQAAEKLGITQLENAEKLSTFTQANQAAEIATADKIAAGKLLAQQASNQLATQQLQTQLAAQKAAAAIETEKARSIAQQQVAATATQSMMQAATKSHTAVTDVAGAQQVGMQQNIAAQQVAATQLKADADRRQAQEEAAQKAAIAAEEKRQEAAKIAAEKKAEEDRNFVPVEDSEGPTRSEMRSQPAQKSGGGIGGFVKNAALLGAGAVGLGGVAYAVSKVAGGLGGVVGGLVNATKAVAGTVSGVSGAISKGNAIARGAGEVAGGAIGTGVRGIGAASSVARGAGEVAGSSIGGVIKSYGAVMDAAKNSGAAVGQAMGSAIKGTQSLSAAANSAGSGIAGAFGKAGSSIAGSAAKVGQAATGAVANTATALQKVQKAASVTGTAMKGASGAIGSVLAPAKTGTAGLLSGLGNSVSGIASGAKGAISSAATAASKFAASPASKLILPVATSAAGAAGAAQIAGSTEPPATPMPKNAIAKFTRPSSPAETTPASELASQSAAVAQNNIVPLVRSSKESGKAIAGELAKGIEESKPQAELAAAGLAQSVSSYLPRSPAEKGPLSNLDQTGFGLTQEFIKGIDGSAIQNKFEEVMNPPSKFAGVDMGGSGGNSSSNAVYSPTYNLSGTPPENFIAELEKHDRKFIEWLQQTQERFNRGRY